MDSVLTESQQKAMRAYTPAKIATLTDKKILSLPTVLVSGGGRVLYKVLTSDRAVLVVLGSVFGPKIQHACFVSGSWIICDKHGNVKAQ